MKFYLDEDLSTRIAERLRRRGVDAVSALETGNGIILCPPTIRGSEIGAIAGALNRVAKRFPEGLGEYDVLYL